jgi:hypothetical protein
MRAEAQALLASPVRPIDLAELVADLSPLSRRRMQALTAWLWDEFGTREAECPSNAAIAERLDIAVVSTAAILIARGERMGLLRLVPRVGAERRKVQLLPNGIRLAQAPQQKPIEPFAAWLVAASPRDRTVYFRGHLAEARSRSPQSQQHAMELNNAVEAARAEGEGLVILAIQRSGGVCEYIAIRTSRKAAR